jgi:hypothetical protein
MLTCAVWDDGTEQAIKEGPVLRATRSDPQLTDPSIYVVGQLQGVN